MVAVCSGGQQGGGSLPGGGGLAQDDAVRVGWEQLHTSVADGPRGLWPELVSSGLSVYSFGERPAWEDNFISHLPALS